MTITKVIFFIHFILLFIYCFPDNYTPQFAQNISSSYANPLFQGRWNLFAPEPPKKHKGVRFRYISEGGLSDWIDPVAGVKERHDHSRVGASTKMYHVLQNGSHYLWEDFYKYSQDSIYVSFGYQSMQHLISALIQQKDKVGSVEMILVVDDVQGLHKNGNNLSDTLHFPKFYLNEIR